MRTRMIWCLCLAMLVLSLSAAAADPTAVQVNGEIRVRNENDNRDFNSDTGYKGFNLMRTRLGIGVQPADDMHAYVQMQDSRVLGIQSVSSVPEQQTDSRLDLHQGYFVVDNLGWKGLGVKAGRMEVRFGNERLIGVNDWDNISTTFDGVMATYGQSRVQLQTLFAKLVERDTPAIGTADLQNSDASLQAAYSTIAVTPKADADLYVINERDLVTPDPNDDVNLFTLGTRIHGAAAERFDYSLEGAYQTGSQETGATSKSDIGGYMFSGALGATIGSKAKPVHVGAAYDYLSGDKGTTLDKREHFDTLFGDTHAFYGLMDIPNVLTSAGLKDLQVNVKGTLYKNTSSIVSAGAQLHNFQLAQAATGASKSLGNEIDATLNWIYRDRFTPALGASVFMPGDAVPDPVLGRSADNSYWLFAQGTVAF